MYYSGLKKKFSLAFYVKEQHKVAHNHEAERKLYMSFHFFFANKKIEKCAVHPQGQSQYFFTAITAPSLLRYFSVSFLTTHYTHHSITIISFIKQRLIQSQLIKLMTF